MGQIILRLIGALILLAGVILIYDARIITKKVFGFPVCAIMDNANDGYFETHPSRFIVIIFQRI